MSRRVSGTTEQHSSRLRNTVRVEVGLPDLHPHDLRHTGYLGSWPRSAAPVSTRPPDPSGTDMMR
jgi:integrase